MKKNSEFTVRKKLLIVFLLITFLFCAVFARLIYLQIFIGGDLQAKALDQWTRDLPLTAKRGQILDRNGIVLADTSTLYNVYVRPNAMREIDKVAKVLSDNLNIDYKTLLDKISKKGVSEITVAKKVEKETMLSIMQSNLKGIYFSQDIERYYPYGDFMTQLMGFINVDGVGQSGLESYYNDYFKGVNGKELTQTDLIGNEIGGSTKYIPAIDGMNGSLTIDYHIQSYAEAAVKNALQDHKAKRATCIVMEPSTGEILAMAGAPSFDLNNIPRNDLELLFAGSKNAAITDVYDPGSTFKILTTAIGIETGKFNTRYSLYCPGYRMVDNQKIKCWRTIGHGSETFAEGVQNSCNCLFMDIALSVGTQTMYEYFEKFGINKKTGIDIKGETHGILINKDSVKNVDIARMGFGQALAITPMELITACASVINGGKLMTPYIMNEIKDTKGMVAYRNYPQEKNQTISAATSKIVRELLEGVVKVGGGKQAYVPGYSIGGKTGTAQKYEDGKIAQGKYVSSFIGFAPVNDPKYITLFIVDEPSTGVYYGSIVAAPYVGQLYRNLFAYAGIKPQYSEDEIPKTFEMPNLIGLSLSDAVALLKSMGLDYEMDGESGLVRYQVPAAGSQVNIRNMVFVQIGE